MRRFFAFVMLAFGVLAAVDVTAGPLVESIRLHDYGAKTRIVLDLNQPVPPYQIGTLSRPDRVTVDFASTALASGFGKFPGGEGVVGAIRSSEQPDGKLRVVFDLKGAVRVDEFVLPASNGQAHRLVIDLHTSRPVNQPVLTAKTSGMPLRDIIIAVDAGHGGRDPGAIGQGKTREKDITLAIGKKLAAMINSEPGMKAVLIRDGDYQLDSRGRIQDLRSRMEKARKNKADLFISIHADAVEDRSASGASVYRLSMNGASSEAAKRLADRENTGNRVGDVLLSEHDSEIAYVLMDLSQRDALDKSDALGSKVLSEISKVSKVHKSKVQSAAFIVLKSPDIPSILVETAYISNPAEEKKLRNSEHQRKLARAILAGAREYFRERPVQNTWLAENLPRQPAEPVRYVINRGDTLSEIAAKYNVSVSAIRNENNLRGNQIRVGQTLMIPVLAGG